MDSIIKSLKGSPSRDIFKFFHKQELPDKYYATDIDLILIDPLTKTSIAAIDFKQRAELEYGYYKGPKISFTERVAYNDLLTKMGLDTYIIYGDVVDDDSIPSIDNISVAKYNYTKFSAAFPNLTEILTKGDKEDYLNWETVLRENHRLKI